MAWADEYSHEDAVSDYLTIHGDWLPSELWPDLNSDVEIELFYEAYVNPELTREEQIEAKYEWAIEYLDLDFEEWWEKYMGE